MVEGFTTTETERQDLQLCPSRANWGSFYTISSKPLVTPFILMALGFLFSNSSERTRVFWAFHLLCLEMIVWAFFFLNRKLLMDYLFNIDFSIKLRS